MGVRKNVLQIFGDVFITSTYALLVEILDLSLPWKTNYFRKMLTFEFA